MKQVAKNSLAFRQTRSKVRYIANQSAAASAIYCEKSQHSALWQLVTQLIIAARFLSAKKPWGSVFAALVMLAIHAPARADSACSGADEYDARPIAATLQPNASAFNPSGRFEVTMQSSDIFTTDIYVRHVVGNKELFRVITRLGYLITVVVGRLPASEGPGFSLRIERGGSGHRTFCTYGFRFQHGVVSYRTLESRDADRGVMGSAIAYDVTDWKSVLDQTSSSGVPIGGLPLPSSTAGTTPTSIGGAAVPGMGEAAGLNGAYYNQEFQFGFLVTGNQGIATVSNSPKYKPGDVMLRFTSSSPKAFTGQQLCTDGVFHPVTGTLADDGSIDMAIQGCFPGRYKMVRQKTPAPQTQSTQQQSAKDGAYIDYWVDVAAREAPDITRRFVNEGLSTVTAGLVSDTILALGSRMPEEIARTITLTPYGFLGWTARIVSKETTKDILKATPIGPAMMGLVIGVVAEAMVDGIREKCPCPALDNYGAIEAEVWFLRQLSAAYAYKTAGMHGLIAAEAFITVVTLVEASKEGIKLGSDLRDEEESKILAAVMQRVKDFSKEINTEPDPQRRAEKLQSLDNYLRHEQTRLPGMAAQFDAWRQKLVANLAQIISLREAPAKQGMQPVSPSMSDGLPPMPFIDYGYQVDLVTGEWRLKRGHTLFAEIADKPRAIETLNAGETVVADQIAIRTFNYEIYEVNEPTVEKFWNHVTEQGVLKIVDTQVALKKGDRIVVLSYFGEGECRVWFKGKTYVAVCPSNTGLIASACERPGIAKTYVAECPPITGAVDNQLTKRRNEIWARVVTNKGLRGYLRDPDALGMSKHD